MPRIDELLGIATFAAAGLFASIALQPTTAGAADTPGVGTHAIVIEVIARRSADPARVERDEKVARDRSGSDPAQPGG